MLKLMMGLRIDSCLVTHSSFVRAQGITAPQGQAHLTALLVQFFESRMVRLVAVPPL